MAKELAIQRFMKDGKDRAQLHQLGIKTHYNEDVMCFSATHLAKMNIDNAYVQEANGLILARDDWRLLMVPVRSMRFNIDTDASNKFLHQGLYHIYYAQDGTCFNMYYYNKWVISTTNGFSMNNVKWQDRTYQDMIQDCLVEHGLTWESFTELLDKTKCYSFGFKHPSIHKFFESDKPTYKIWFIQSVDLNAESETYLWSSDTTPDQRIPSQIEHKEPVGNLKELYKAARCALDDYLKNKKIFYGYILRSVNYDVTGQHSDLYIESSLMGSIRRFWYDNKLVDKCNKNQWDKEKAITLNAYLDRDNYEIFRLLFNQYQDVFDKYSLRMKDVVDKMLLNDSEPDDIGLAAARLYSAFKSYTKYNIANKSVDEKRKILFNYINHPVSLEILYPIM